MKASEGIVKLHFVRPEVTAASRAAADHFNHLSAVDVSHFLLMATRAEGKVLETFRAQVKVHEQELRELKEIRIERIIKNHAQLLALVDALRLVVPLTDRQHATAQRELVAMNLVRQSTVNADLAEVAEFWEVYDYLQSLSEDPVVDHSMIAINLNEFAERAAEHKQKLADIGTLRNLLPNSRSRKFIEKNRAVDSAVRDAFNRRNLMSGRGPTVKCWMFQNPDVKRGNA